MCFVTVLNIPDVRFVLNTIHSTLRRSRRVPEPLHVTRRDANPILDSGSRVGRRVYHARLFTRPYAATETAGPGGEARCGDEPRTDGPPSARWPSRRGERDRRDAKRDAGAWLCVLSPLRPVSRGSVYVRAKIGAKHFLMSGTTPLHDFEMKAAQYILSNS